MPLIVTSGVLVRLVWSSGGLPFAVNVLGGTGVAPASVNQAFANALGSAIKGQLTTSGHVLNLHTSTALANVGVRSVGIANQPEFLDAGGPVSGGTAGKLLPPQVAQVVTLRTALAGKSFRGRVYLGGFADGSLTAQGTQDPGSASAGVAFVTGIQTAFTSNGLTLAIMSRKSNVGTPVTLIMSRTNTWETQRRRATIGI